MGAVVIDTNVVLAAFDPTDAHHETAAAALRDLRDTRATVIVSAVTMAEALVRPPGQKDRSRVSDYFDSSLVSVHPVDRSVARACAELRRRHRSLKLPDALIAATAAVLGAPLLTADRKMARVERAILLK